MNQKVSLQEIIHIWMTKHNIDSKVSEEFANAFFSLIIEGLEKDGYVKIKGLGTFKVISIESRESINVNTGERFEIQEHNKVSFTPDNEVRDRINKPFAHFETVILNEHVSFEGEQSTEASSIEVTPEEISGNKTIPSKDVSVQEEVSAPTEKEKPHQSSRRWIRVVFMVVIGLALAYMVYDLAFTTMMLTSETNVTIPINASDDIIIEEVSLPLDADTTIDILPSADTTQLMTSFPQEEIPVHADSTSYTIVGIKATHVLSEGETLIRVALRYYGTKDLWPYLLIFNREKLPNPNLIKVGTVLRVPELKKK